MTALVLARIARMDGAFGTGVRDNGGGGGDAVITAYRGPRSPTKIGMVAAAAELPVVTVVDLDRTATVRGTYSPFLLFAAARRQRWRLALVPLVLAAMTGHKLRLLGRKRLKEVMQGLLLGRRIATEELNALAESYADRVMRRNLHPGALDFVARERAGSSLVILATAAHRFYAEPIARRLGIGEVVATGSVSDARGVSHRILGDNCHGPAKAEAVLARLAELGIDRAATRLRFYSDDHSDLPMFAASDERIAVHPCARLRRHACAHGWRILSLASAHLAEPMIAAAPGTGRTPLVRGPSSMMWSGR